MAGQVDIELGELTNSDQPSETTRFTPDDSQRYAGNFITSKRNNCDVERFRDYSAKLCGKCKVLQ